MTTREDIRGWLAEAQSVGATHMIVKWDDFEGPYADYPVMVMPGEDPREVAKKHSDPVVEVYALHVDLESQLAEHRSFHWEML
jgi:hypothetical protein